MITAANNPLIV